jgi:SAM-dependent methyltransferase
MTQASPWNWDRVEEGYWLEPAAEVRILLERWKAAGYSRLLDLGSGLGRHSLLFARAGFEVTGFDLSEFGLAKLRDMARAEGLGIMTAMGDLRDLPFDEGAFDCVLAYRSIYHCDFQGLVDCVAELRRVLSAGGELFANFLSADSPYYAAGEGATSDPRVRTKLEEGGAVLPHCYLSEGELRELLSAFEIRRLLADADAGASAASRYYTVLASPA